MLIENSEICNFSDNKTFYICGMEFMTLGKKWHKKIIKPKTSPTVMNENDKVQLFGIKIICKLTFDENLDSLGFNDKLQVIYIMQNKKILKLRTKQRLCPMHFLIAILIMLQLFGCCVGRTNK